MRNSVEDDNDDDGEQKKKKNYHETASNGSEGIGDEKIAFGK